MKEIGLTLWSCGAVKEIVLFHGNLNFNLIALQRKVNTHWCQEYHIKASHRIKLVDHLISYHNHKSILYNSVLRNYMWRQLNYLF